MATQLIPHQPIDTRVLNYGSCDELIEALKDSSPDLLDWVARRNGFDPIAYCGKYGRNEMAADVAAHLWQRRAA